MIFHIHRWSEETPIPHKSNLEIMAVRSCLKCQQKQGYTLEIVLFSDPFAYHPERWINISEEKYLETLRNKQTVKEQ